MQMESPHHTSVLAWSGMANSYCVCWWCGVDLVYLDLHKVCSIPLEDVQLLPDGHTQHRRCLRLVQGIQVAPTTLWHLKALVEAGKVVHRDTIVYRGGQREIEKWLVSPDWLRRMLYFSNTFSCIMGFRAKVFRASTSSTLSFVSYINRAPSAVPTSRRCPHISIASILYWNLSMI